MSDLMPPVPDPHSIACPAGTILFRAGDPCRGFVDVRRGSIRVSLTAASGREVVLYRVAPGEICLQTFSCLVDSHDYAAEGVAETDLEATLIPPGQFRAMLAGDDAFRDRVMHAVSGRFTDFLRFVEDVTLAGLEARLARALLRLQGPDGLVHATHETLAREAGSAREAVSRQLAAFRQQGLVEMGRGHVRILAPARLVALVDR
jgi:CRP/FNR family transcriptional regulator